MRSHVLLNSLNELRKRNEMSGIWLNKFSNKGAPMLDSFYHMTLKFIQTDFVIKTSRFYTAV